MQLHRRHEDVRAAGAEIFVIGNGAPMFIEGFRETTGYRGPVYTDPSLAAYRAARLERGVRTLLSVGAAARTVGALARGFRQGRTQGDNLQQGGALVVAREGSVLWHHVSKSPGDNADPDQIIRVLRGGTR